MEASRKAFKELFPFFSVPPRVTFLGAAGEVTGSMHLVEVGPRRILLDCGVAQDRGEDRDPGFPFSPDSVDAVVLSHGHADHCGRLPELVRQGFAGPIYCTPATRDLLAVILDDPATVRRCVALDYDRPLSLCPEVRVRFLEAGHVLGSAVVVLTLTYGGREYGVTFTGDLGRMGLPFHRRPSPVPAADLLISEGTYGGQVHGSAEEMGWEMGEVVRRVAARGGKVLIPAFSLGRTQVVLHYLREWMAFGLVPRLPVYVDSPLTARISGVYEQHPGSFLASRDAGVTVEFLRSRDEARARSAQPDPCVIVASGGMCDRGRILWYLRRHVTDARSAVVLVSYQAPGTLGAKLLEGRAQVRIDGKVRRRRIEVVQIRGFSSHPDQGDFEELLAPAAALTGKVRLVHGEPRQLAKLASSLRGMGFGDVKVAEPYDTVEVT